MSDVVTERPSPWSDPSDPWGRAEDWDSWVTGASLDLFEPRDAAKRGAPRVRSLGFVGVITLVERSLEDPARNESAVRWQRFLGDLTGPRFGLSERHARAIRELWTNLLIAVGPRLPLPQVDATEAGSIKLCWSRPQYYAEIELHPEDDEGRCRHEWFFRDRVDDTHDGSTEPESGAPPLRLLGLLQRATGG